MIRDIPWYRLEKDILAQSDTQGSVLDSGGGFRNTGGARRTGGQGFNRNDSAPMISGGQALVMDAPPGSKAGDIVNTPDGQMLVLPGDKTMSPIPTPIGSPRGEKLTSEQINQMMA